MCWLLDRQVPQYADRVRTRQHRDRDDSGYGRRTSKMIIASRYHRRPVQMRADRYHRHSPL
jgi:hypothetical protein